MQTVPMDGVRCADRPISGWRAGSQNPRVVQLQSSPAATRSVVNAASPEETSVLIAVASPKVREALSAAIGALEGYRVVGEASTDGEALELARTLRPALAIVDEDLPGCCGTWTMQEMKLQHLVGGIVAIGLRANGGVRSLAAGAREYVQTGDSLDALVTALGRARAVRGFSH